MGHRRRPGRADDQRSERLQDRVQLLRLFFCELLLSGTGVPLLIGSLDCEVAGAE